MLLTQAAEVTRLTAGLRAGLGRWRKPLAVHDPGKVPSDLVLSLALGGDCLADLSLLRAEPGVYGPVASAATVSRTMSALSRDDRAALRAVNQARAAAQARAWELAGTRSPAHWSTFLVSAFSDRALMHPRCHQAIALLARHG